MTASLQASSVERPATSRAAPDFAPIDRLVVAYAVCAYLVLGAHALGWHGGFPIREGMLGVLVAHALLAALPPLAARARCARQPEEVSVVATYYPLLVLPALYTAVGLVNHHGGSPTLGHDATVQRWDAALFGGQVAFVWARSAPSSLLDWSLATAYLGFYPLVLAAPTTLWIIGRRRAAQRTIFGTTLAFLACYLVFLMFPVAGPPYCWAWPHGGEIWPMRTVRWLIESGDAWGSAFPSSHVAVSTAGALLAARGWAPAGWLCLPLAGGIALGVVYCQVHYGVDAVAGLVVGLGAYQAAMRIEPS